MPNVPVPKTWVDQDFATAPVMNTELRDMLNFLLAPPRLVLSRVAAFSVTSGADTVVPWDTEILDTFGMWTSATPTRITMQVPGKYRVSVVGSFAATASPAGVRIMRVRLNGVTPRYNVVQSAATTSTSSETIVTSSMTLPYTFAIGEYIEIMPFHSQGSALNFSGSSDSYVTVEWMGS